MRVAIIDLGTNSVRFDVHQISVGGKARQLHREKLMIRLGQGVFVHGKLDKNAIRRATHAFRGFQRVAEQFHVRKTVAFATSALREATDGARLTQAIKKQTGIEIRIISGEEEAQLIASGILNHEESLKGHFGLIDIGGGSTEISICKGKSVLHSMSFPLGTARLQQLFLKKSPPRSATKNRPGAVQELRQYIRSMLMQYVSSHQWPSVSKVIGSSGTIRACGKMLRKGGSSKAFELEDLQDLVKEMETMTTTQLLGVSGMEAKRVDMILAGAVLLEECLRALNAEKVFTTEHSLRDGILDEEIRLILEDKASHLALHLDDLYMRARRLGIDVDHARRAVESAEDLFDRLRAVHGLKPQWKVYLSAAVILRDTGEAITPGFHEVHSYYIVKNANFPSMEAWECDFIANLCLFHQTGKIDFDDTVFGDDKVKRQAFTKLLALLRVIDALDSGHGGKKFMKSVSARGKQVKLVVSRKMVSDIELLKAERRRALFEEEFGKELEIKRG